MTTPGLRRRDSRDDVAARRRQLRWRWLCRARRGGQRPLEGAEVAPWAGARVARLPAVLSMASKSCPWHPSPVLLC